MTKEGNIILGILAIILGLIVIIFPLLSFFTASMIAGIGILFLGVWFLIQFFALWDANKRASIAYLIFGILALIVGIGLFGNILAFSLLISLWLYIAGLFLIMSGILCLFTKPRVDGKVSGASGIMIGILYIVLAAYAWNPFYLGVLIGIWLIIDGITLFFINRFEMM